MANILDAVANIQPLNIDFGDVGADAITKLPISGFESKAAGQYTIGKSAYPVNVGGKDLQNYVNFYINVQTDSKIAKDRSSEISGISPNARFMNGSVGDTARNFSNNNPTNMVNFGAALAAEGGVLGAVAGAINGGDLTSKIVGAGAGILKGAAAGAATGVGIGAIFTGAGITFGQPAKRLREFITLYTPQQVTVRYGAQWGEEDAFTAALASDPELANSLKAAGNSASTAGGAVSGVLAGKILSSNSPFASSLSALTRTAANPKKEQIFKSVDYRSFTFEYSFAPKSAEEARAALKIIYLFKYHMHPEFKDKNTFVYVYPSEFDIEYFFAGKENSSLNKISSCVLKEMTVNYSPNGTFTTFPDGTPTQINMTLQFVELETLTKERIEAGL
jgi:hypothetical protein